MGVPKFYRWISERYPCLSQIIKDYQIPEFDNFYLDMNGIIHVCSHPNDDDPTFRISEDKIFSDIFNYLESLFRMIKPQKVIFMAVDGVAPRAKMNQQRGRRFRSAREAQDLIRKAVQRGEVLPSVPRFDSNCITPGTEFMARLHQHLKYFVHKKLSTDISWQGVEVILSGQDVPGEGEHKIMDYIRNRKSQPDYDPNTRHCLYGLDADLMMLGLLSHEPHFSLLREEVRFGRKSQKRANVPDTVTFHLLHLSIMRECLDFEFSAVKDKLPFKYDLEKIIDDWILMGFLVGNDFLPHLPNMHIRQDALPYLYGKYKEVLPTLDGYINNNGDLNMANFEAYLKALAQFDVDHYSDLSSGLQWLEGKKSMGRGHKKSKKDRRSSHGFGKADSFSAMEDDLMFPAALVGDEEGEEDIDGEVMGKLQRDLGIRDLESFFKEEDEEKDRNFQADFTEFKASYYKEKFHFSRVDEGVLAEQAKCYVVGIQWVLNYYYSGVPSWSWFYPYHYAPFVSDVRGFSDIQIEFELGKPFFPYQQLLGVLPPASKSLLPMAYQCLMVNEDSPIKDFYPVEFATDLNGKQQEWEAVVLIPFIDEVGLMAAMEPCTAQLDKEEMERNTLGVCLVCVHDAGGQSSVYPSPWPQVFPDVSKCRVRVTELPSNPYPVRTEDLVQGLCEGVKLDVYFPGFPSLKHVQHAFHFERRGVRVFQSASRDENLILTVSRSDLSLDISALSKKMIGRTCFVGWPYLVEAKVHSLANKEKLYCMDKVGGKIQPVNLGEAEVKKFKEESTIVTRRNMERRGIDIGEVTIMVYAQVLQGKRYIMDKRKGEGVVCLHKEWAAYPEPHPLQTTVLDIAAFAPEYKDQATTLSELYPVGAHCFLVSSSHYGRQAEVLSVDLNQIRIQVLVQNKLVEPNLFPVTRNRHLSVRYLPSYIVGEKLGLSGLLLSRITGTIQVERGSPDNTKDREKLNVGLSWKFSRKNLEIPGYARKMDNGGWSYSTEAVTLLQDFMTRFPMMFLFLSKNSGTDKYYESDLFPGSDGPESLSGAREWMKRLPSAGLDSVDCGSILLDAPQVAAIEEAVKEAQSRQRESKPTKLRVKPSALFKPSYLQGNVIPDPSTSYELYDRVVNVALSNAVPFGLRGTVIGIPADQSDNSTMYEVLFDEEFLGGLTLRCSPNRAYRLPAACLLNITYGVRAQEMKSIPKSAPQKSYQQTGASYASAAHQSHTPSPRQGHTPSPRHPRLVGGAYNSADGNIQRQPHGPGRGRGFSPGYVRVMSSGTEKGATPGRTPGRGRGKDPRSSTPSRVPLQNSGQTSGLAAKQPSVEVKGQQKEVSEFSAFLQEMTATATAAPSHPSSAVKTTPSQAKTQKDAGDKKSDFKKKAAVSKGSAAPKEKVEDRFSAAMDALTRLNISSPGAETVLKDKGNDTSVLLQGTQAKHGSKSQPKLGEGEGGRKEGVKEARHLEKGTEEQSRTVKPAKPETKAVEEVVLESGGKDSRELSPSVAAIFEAAGNTLGQSPVKSGSMDSQKPGINDSSTALKNLLNIGTPSPNPLPPSSSRPPSHPMALQPNPQNFSPAVLKLMRPSMLSLPGYSPRPGLLPSPQMRGVSPQMMIPPRYHTVPPPRGPPLIMPYGPPPTDDYIQQLKLTAHSAGLPHPKISSKPVPNGFIGLVEVGAAKFKGAVCSSRQLAEQSAANVANINLKPQSGPRHPLLYFSNPVPSSPFSPPSIHPPPPPHPSFLRGHMPPYPPPRLGGQTPPRMSYRAPNPFIPLQVQRRQMHKPPDSPASAKQNGKLAETAMGGLVQGVPKKDDFALETGDIAVPKSVGINGTDKSVSAPCTTTPSGASAAADDGVFDESVMLKRMEDTLKSTLDTQGQLQQMTQLIGALERAPKEFPQTAPVVEPVSETGTPPRNVHPVGDTVAHVAIVAAELEDSVGGGEEVQLEVSHQPSNSAGANEGEVVVAGEILSGASVGGREARPLTGMEAGMEPPVTRTEPAGSKADTRMEDRETALKESSSPTFDRAPKETAVNLDSQAPGASSSSPNMPQSPALANPNEPSAPTKAHPKRPRFQLAASFTHQQ